MEKSKKKIVSQKKRHFRTRKKVKGTASRPRLSVFRSNKYIYTQLIDDKEGITLASVSELEEDFLESAKDLEEKEEDTKNRDRKTEKSRKLSKTEKAKLVGKIIAQRALKKGIKKVIFDRGGYKYHGRMKALADGAREEGLIF